MMTLNLWRAEWLKARKRFLNRAMLGVMLVIVLVAFVAVTGIGYFYPGSDLSETTVILPFPESLGMALELLGHLGLLLVVVFVANSVGGEYARDTWKVILPRYGSRTAFLMTKWVVGRACRLAAVRGVYGRECGGTRLVGRRSPRHGRRSFVRTGPGGAPPPVGCPGPGIHLLRDADAVWCGGHTLNHRRDRGCPVLIGDPGRDGAVSIVDRNGNGSCNRGSHGTSHLSASTRDGIHPRGSCPFRTTLRSLRVAAR